MKSFIQTFTLIVAGIALVGGITFVNQWMRPAPEEATTQADSADEGQVKLKFPLAVRSDKGVQTVTARRLPQDILPDGDDASKRDPMPAVYSELYTEGHYDFWCQNPNKAPVSLVNSYVSCICSSLSLGTFRPEDWTRFIASQEGKDALAQLNNGEPIDKLQPAARAFLEKAEWQDLAIKTEKDIEPAPRTIAGAISEEIPTPVIVRMKWAASHEGKLGPNLLSIELKADKATDYKLEVPVTIVRALFPYPPKPTLDRTLTSGSQEQATSRFYCWSSTRPHFDLIVKVVGSSECIVTQSRPLSADEIEEVRISSKIPYKALYGYRVDVTVHERRNGHQLDLGPFSRKIEMTYPGSPIVYDVELTGSVRGDVGIPSENPKERDRIPFGEFLSPKGKTQTVTLEANRPGVELEVVEKNPDFLEAKLGPPRQSADGRTTWDLTVTVPPNLASGRFRDDAAVVLKTKDTPPRCLRLPVVGIAKAR